MIHYSRLTLIWLTSRLGTWWWVPAGLLLSGLVLGDLYPGVFYMVLVKFSHWDVNKVESWHLTSTWVHVLLWKVTFKYRLLPLGPTPFSRLQREPACLQESRQQLIAQCLYYDKKKKSTVHNRTNWFQRGASSSPQTGLCFSRGTPLGTRLGWAVWNRRGQRLVL